MVKTNNNSKCFWSKCKPSFSNKYLKGGSDILLIENDEIYSKARKLQLFSTPTFRQLLDLLIYLITSVWRYTNADLIICQYLRLHMKIICRRFHIKTPFTSWDMHTWDMRRVCLQTFRTIEYVKNWPTF